MLSNILCLALDGHVCRPVCHCFGKSGPGHIFAQCIKHSCASYTYSFSIVMNNLIKIIIMIIVCSNRFREWPQRSSYLKNYVGKKSRFNCSFIQNLMGCSTKQNVQFDACLRMSVGWKKKEKNITPFQSNNVSP